ncbi:MAG: hypothetical protein JRI44_11020 [Deltaproteobacteria bacterium]|nr:hypothetical protein [Deltaproteobacteria bacterium]
MIEIKDDKFYILDSENGKWIFATEDEAIKKLKDTAKKSNPEKTRIIEVDISGDEWSIKQVPWSKIAMKIIGGD